MRFIERFAVRVSLRRRGRTTGDFVFFILGAGRSSFGGNVILGRALRLCAGDFAETALGLVARDVFAFAFFFEAVFDFTGTADSLFPVSNFRGTTCSISVRR